MYRNRTEAGRELAKDLQDYRDQDAIVLALPRGGVELGYEIAEAIDAGLDVLVVRKLGAPQNPEFGLGAIASYGAEYLDETALRALDVPSGALKQVEEREREELERRELAYRDAMPPPDIEGRTVIIVDDGIATGGTVKAAIRAVRNLYPSQIVLAVPVAPADAVADLQDEVDAIVCPLTPSPFRAIGLWYGEFEQTPDERVVELLRRRRTHAASQH